MSKKFYPRNGIEAWHIVSTSNKKDILILLLIFAGWFIAGLIIGVIYL
jgi:hypothetical protein